MLVGYAVSSKNVPCAASRVEGDFDIVALQHRGMREVSAAKVLQAADVQRQQLGLRDLCDHLCNLSLHQLVPGDGPVAKLLAYLSVLEKIGRASCRERV